VSDLPFPYVSVDQYEQSIRAPIGKTWNPETAVKELVKPKVVTKLGTIIQPIDKADVFKHQNKKHRPDMSFNAPKSTNVTGRHKKRK
jgi:U3 small nucleolar RNA-associated protein 14